MAATGAKNICGCEGTPEPDPVLVEAIKALPPSSETRDFEKRVYELLKKQFDEKNRTWLDVCQALNAVIVHRVDPQECKNVAYAALYALFTRARRENRLDLCERLLKDNEELAGARASYDHMWAMLHASRRTGDDLDKAFDRAESALDKVKDHIGIDHSYAEIVALRAEAGQTKREDPEFETALKLARKAVQGEGTYAKFHATVGRLMAVRGSLDEAERYVRQALSREFDNWDSDARRVEYRGILTQIQLERQREAIRKEMEKVKDQVEETKTKHVEILGVFSGILALILAGLAGLFQAAGQGDAASAGNTALAMLIVLPAMAGTILAVFSGLGRSIHDAKEGPRVVSRLAGYLIACAVALAGVFVAVAYKGWLPEPTKAQTTSPQSGTTQTPTSKPATNQPGRP